MRGRVEDFSSEVSKLQPIGQIWPTSCFAGDKFSLEQSPHLLMIAYDCHCTTEFQGLGSSSKASTYQV
jgi:hypothetical protein